MTYYQNFHKQKILEQKKNYCNKKFKLGKINTYNCLMELKKKFKI